MSSEGEITALLQAWRHGEAAAFDALVPLVYRELHQLAVLQMRTENSGHTLSPTALLHESFLKLVGSSATPDWQDRKHFYVVAARVMRRLLIDHARAKRAGKRDPADFVLAAAVLDRPSHQSWDVFDLDRALDKLREQQPLRVEMLELRHFGGMGVREIAEILNISPATVSRHLRVTEAWLSQEIRGKAD